MYLYFNIAIQGNGLSCAVRFLALNHCVLRLVIMSLKLGLLYNHTHSVIEPKCYISYGVSISFHYTLGDLDFSFPLVKSLNRL